MRNTIDMPVTKPPQEKKDIVTTINAGASYGRLDNNKDSRERVSLLYLQLSFACLVWGVNKYEKTCSYHFPYHKNHKVPSQ